MPSTVAAAAPPMPQPKSRIKSGSSRMLTPVPAREMSMDFAEEPSARRALPRLVVNIITGEPSATMVR